jgi:hypothetical protein
LIAAALLQVLEEIGVTVRVDGYELCISPRAALSPALADSIRRRKRDLIDALSGVPTSDRMIEAEFVPASAGLVPRLGSIVSTPAGPGRLIYLTIYGAIVQIASGLMYTVDPRRVRSDEN